VSCVVVAAAVAGLALVAAAAALADATTGTWTGKLVIPQEPEIPSSAYPSTRLVVGAATVQSRFSGLTQAAHDPPAARATCAMTFRFARVADGWRLYRQGRPQLVGTSSGGMPEFSPCQTPSGGMLRIRPAAGKLKVEFTTFYRASEPYTASFRGYLHH